MITKKKASTRFLSDLAETFLGITFRGRDATAHTEIGTHQLIRIGDISDSGAILCAKKNLIVLDKRTIEKFELRKGDVILASRGDRMAVAVFDLDIKAIVGSQFYVIRLRGDPVTPSYLCWYLSQDQSKLASISSGTYIKSISKDSLGTLEIPVPSLDQQSAIVELNKLLQQECELLLKIAEKKPLLINGAILKEFKK